MPEDAFCIFVVDDDPLLRTVIVDQLQVDNYQIHEFASGADCLAALDLQPNLILLDIEMPRESGLEICRSIRDNYFDDVQVIFVSSHDDLDTLLAAYEAGGNDFIPKNVKQNILLYKVNLALNAEKKKRDLQQMLSYAQQTAFTAMSSLGETGVVLQFLRMSFFCDSLEKLGQLLIDTLNQFGLKGMIKLSSGDRVHFCCSDKPSTPLEESILSYVSKLDRITQYGNRLVCNYPHITMLILDLNSCDEEGVGRLRDHCAVISEGAGVRIDAMMVEQERLRQANARIQDANELVGLLDEIEHRQHVNHVHLENLIDSHYQQIENAFIYLGLTDSQEQLLENIISHLTSNLAVIFDNDSRLALRLSQVVTKQKALLQAQ